MENYPNTQSEDEPETHFGMSGYEDPEPEQSY